MSLERPWMTIWYRPKATISRVVAENPDKGLWFFAYVYGFLSVLSGLQVMSFGAFLGPIHIILIAALFAPLWGICSFGLWGWLITQTGKLLKGTCTFKEARAAFAWSCTPLVVNLVCWGLLVGWMGASLFLFHKTGIFLSSSSAAALIVIITLKVTMNIWSLMIYLNALAAVQRFSVIKAIFNVLLAWIIFCLVLIGGWFGLVWLLGPTTVTVSVDSLGMFI